MTESVWKLLHKEQPEDGSDCYFGFKERGDDLFVRMASQYGYQSLELDSLEMLRS